MSVTFTDAQANKIAMALDDLTDVLDRELSFGTYEGRDSKSADRARKALKDGNSALNIMLKKA
jgi:hypothetical protein